ncbi:HNH endonuclease signature motif containing protein [Microbacterium saperdae]|uniref:Uncharacterized protein DUF222 n=1 Tax=Microbacterium saperdae TaxID=69368 RepID=A0A543BKI4_9MICO|nr:HNH endonuclease signature motif containing protein [Microbacterium saperdae]TQL85283.1 uncharacterized protein DUF222 [Microbacterium saperdae]GGM55470.1 hypothetical protein GCM10010489_28840 [Microbacterium saperdae]
MLAARDGMLAMASRLAIDIARQANHPDYGDMATRAVAAEIGAAQRVNDRTIERRMAAASRLVTDLPDVWAAQGAGRITAAHTRVIVEAGAHLDDPRDRAAYAAAVLVIAEAESPNRLRRHARRIAERFQARSLTERHRDARDNRRVWVNDLDDGMSELGVQGPSTLIHGMYDRLSQMAHRVREENARAAKERKARDARPASDDPSVDSSDEPSDDRTVDQLRADLLADLVLTGAPTGHHSEDALLDAIHARVEVTVPVMTLMDECGSRTDLPAAELDGRCPIDAATARRIAGAAIGWDRVLTHPISGALLAVDRYRPGDQLKRHLRARDQRCRFPTCGLAARRCDIDHTHAAAEGGPTCEDNLAHFCRRHHMMKHHSPWQVEQRVGGVLEWRSPTGDVYIDHAPAQNTARFTPAESTPAEFEAAAFGTAESTPVEFETAESALVPF